MFDRPIVAFDIECIPDPELGREVWGLSGTDLEVVQAMAERRLRETDGTNRYPALPWHRVVCVCATTFEPRTGQVRLSVLGGDEASERYALAGFFDLFEGDGPGPRLVSWNGGGYDLPVLRYRGMRHGLSAPALYGGGGDRRAGGYLHRYQDLRVDLMDVLCSHGTSTRAGLAATAEAMGLPGKGFLEGHVYEQWLGGERERVLSYCKLDTLLTFLVFLSWTHHTGALAAQGFARIMASVRWAIEGERDAGWLEVQKALTGWPGWLPKNVDPEG
jgi:predicted PolB exonuclease-like 3'-5' exonuclease